MSETDNDISEASEPIEEPTVEPAEKPKVYSSSSKSSFRKAPPSHSEVIPDALPGDVVEKIRISLQEDHGWAGNDMPTSESATISAWAAIVTKTGTFADALKALGD